MSRPLPAAQRERWQPLRLGLVELFHYDQEEFWFRDGRLLLRGNNGTGKSKVLALTLPYLLDGDMRPTRVEPDADGGKRMEWNLLLGGDHAHDERVGYTWVEFGRRDADGTERHTTLGCGMKAVKGRGGVQQWLFLTDLRVGVDLHLVDADRVPLTRDRLQDALGPRGQVFHRDAKAAGNHTARYRRAVDERLFGLGERRYDALIDLLVRARQPQLSKRPRAETLSRALTEALPPLDPALLADLADAFRSLEADRNRLRTTESSLAAARTYQDVYRRYARIAARRRARGPREAQSEVDGIGRAITDATAARDAAGTQRDELDGLLRTLAEEDETLEAQRRALDASDEARSARSLEIATGRVTELAQAREASAGDHDGAVAEAALREARLADAEREQSVAATTLTDARRATLTAAGDAGVPDPLIAALAAGLDAEDADLLALRRTTDAEVDGHRRAVETVVSRLAAEQVAAEDHRRARAELADRETEQADQETARQAAESELEARVEAHVDATRTAVAGWAVLALEDAEAVLGDLGSWARTIDGPDPLARAAAAALAVVRDAVGVERTAVERRREDLAAALRDVRVRIERLERGEDDEPPAPPTRAADARTGRVGAPLWRLVEFEDGVAAHERAGLEAALLASGLLDAWVAPDGRLLGDAPDGDAWGSPGDAPPATDGAGLRRLLRPASGDDAPVPANVVDALLRRIAVTDGAHADPATFAAVAVDGRFRQGLLAGRHRAAAARYVGRAAREAARRKALDDARDEASELEAADAEARAALDAHERRLQTANAEHATLPADEHVRRAHAAVSLATELGRRVAERVAAARDAVGVAAARLEAARDVLRRTATDLGLPAERPRVEAIAAAIPSLREALAALWPAARASEGARRRRGDAARERQVAADRAATFGDRLAAADTALRDATGYRDELQATVGAAVLELQRRRGGIDARRRQIATDRRDRLGRLEEAKRQHARAEAQLELRGEELQAAGWRRSDQARALQAFAASGVLAAALPEAEIPPGDGPWSVTVAVGLARRIEQEVVAEPDDDEAWRRSLARVQDDVAPLAEALSVGGDRVGLRPVDEGTLVVDVHLRGVATTVAGLTATLESDVADRRRLLDEREREILENHLIDEVAAALQERIVDAEQQVARMTRELHDRPTSTGMELRLLWRTVPDGPAGLAAARERLLRQSSAVWSDDDRVAVGTFLQAQIQALRSQDPSRPWLEQLTEAFDYRAWHHFVVERRQGGRWRSATGPASGGERVLAATVPLFAAASSHYASASNEHAPRLVLLDEAFAGVDDDSRAKCLGLLAAFDLDVVMTSEREWGCYPEVPGLAIAQLSRTDGIDAVLVTPWEWNGAVRARVEPPRPVRAPAPPSTGGTPSPDAPVDPDQVSLLDALAGGPGGDAPGSLGDEPQADSPTVDGPPAVAPASSPTADVPPAVGPSDEASGRHGSAGDGS